MERSWISRRRITPVLLLLVLPLTGLVCSQGPTGTQGTEAPPVSGAEAKDAPTPAPIPDGWKVTQDATGACQVATPPDWQLGTDFFLAMEEADPGPFASAPGAYPPSGLALWGIGDGTVVPEGTRYQIRTSRVNDGQVCSVWRVKAGIDFTDDEKSEMEQVGATLQEVQ